MVIFWVSDAPKYCLRRFILSAESQSMNRLFSFLCCRGRIRALLIFLNEVSMTEKQKITVAVGVGLLVIAFAFIYRQFADQRSALVNESSVMPLPPTAPAPAPSSDSLMKDATMQEPVATPETPDAVVDDILKNDANTSALDNEAAGETQTAKENVQTIDDITNAYDDTQL